MSKIISKEDFISLIKNNENKRIIFSTFSKLYGDGNKNTFMLESYRYICNKEEMVLYYDEIGQSPTGYIPLNDKLQVIKVPSVTMIDVLYINLIYETVIIELQIFFM